MCRLYITWYNTWIDSNRALSAVEEGHLQSIYYQEGQLHRIHYQTISGDARSHAAISASVIAPGQSELFSLIKKIFFCIHQQQRLNIYYQKGHYKKKANQKGQAFTIKKANCRVSTLKKAIAKNWRRAQPRRELRVGHRPWTQEPYSRAVLTIKKRICKEFTIK